MPGLYRSTVALHSPGRGNGRDQSHVECELPRGFRIDRAFAHARIIDRMPITLDGQLVVAISSRALFDFEEENQHFEATNDRAYMRLQLDRLDTAAKPGVAFSLVNKLLAFNAATPRVEVVILSRNDPVSGMRVFRSAQHYGLPIQRGVFTRGESPWRYLKPLNAHLFLSTNEADVRSALGAGKSVV